jgi:hypothetical protein
VLHANPIFLRVTLKNKVSGELGAHKALMVVRRRIDEVAEDLSGRPLPVEGAGRLVFGHGAKFVGGAIDKVAEFTGKCVHRELLQTLKVFKTFST